MVRVLMLQKRKMMKTRLAISVPNFRDTELETESPRPRPNEGAGAGKKSFAARYSNNIIGARQDAQEYQS